ncbi:U2SURP, partial [Symbiodinium sp. CCMP2456]
MRLYDLTVEAPQLHLVKPRDPQRENPRLSLEEARKEWLIDRLAELLVFGDSCSQCRGRYQLELRVKEGEVVVPECYKFGSGAYVTYELLAHEKEQARMQAAKEEAAARLARRKSRGMEDIDGEDLADGFPMDDAELDGEPLELSTPGEIFQAVELAKQAPEALASYLGTVGGAEELLGNFVLGAALVESSPSEEVISVISAEETQGRAQEAAQDDSQEMLDIQRPDAGQGSSKEEASPE